MAHHIYNIHQKPHLEQRQRRPNLRQATEARLQEIKELVRSGVTEHTGKAMRRAREEGGEAIGKRFRGLKPSFPELERISDSPSRIAAAIEAGQGRAFDRVYRVVEDAMAHHGFKPSRQAGGRPTVPPHESVRPYCHHCREFHTKNKHRFHGTGSFHRTHLFSFGAMNPRGAGRAFYFLGSFTSKLAAAKAERRHPGSFIHRAENGRYYVLKPKKIRTNTPIPAAVRTFAIKHQINVGRDHNGIFTVYTRKGRAVHHSQTAGGVLAWMRRLVKFRARILQDNPAAGFAAPGGKTKLGKLVEIRYERTAGRAPGLYRHPFTVRPAVYYDRAKNRITIQG